MNKKFTILFFVWGLLCCLLARPVEASISTFNAISAYPIGRSSEPAIYGQYAAWTGCNNFLDEYCDGTSTGLIDRLYFFNGNSVAELAAFPKATSYLSGSVGIFGNQVIYQDYDHTKFFQYEIPGFVDQGAKQAPNFSAYVEEKNLFVEKNGVKTQVDTSFLVGESYGIGIFDQSGDYLLLQSISQGPYYPDRNLYLYDYSDNSVRIVDQSIPHDVQGSLYNNHIYYWEGVDFERLYYARYDGGAAHAVPEPSTLGLLGLGLIGAFARRKKIVNF